MLIPRVTCDSVAAAVRTCERFELADALLNLPRAPTTQESASVPSAIA
jgi:hypothetical protein